MVDFKQIVRPNILGLEPYRCARDDFKEGILLDANENTHGPALAAVQPQEQKLELNRYPDPHQVDLKTQICDYRNQHPNRAASKPLEPANLCLGVGLDESIDLLIRCVCTPGKDKMLVCPPTYGMYGICATINDVEVVKVPLQYPSFQIDVDAIVEAVDREPVKLIYLTSPGNPTAKVVDVDQVLELSKRLADKPVLLVVDEAYIDFCDPTLLCCTLVNTYANVVVMQTLSKAFGLAGIRLGITYADRELLRYLNAMKYPYNISLLTLEVALRAMSAEGIATMRKYVELIVSQRKRVCAALDAMEGIGRNLGGLDANFILYEVLDRDGKPSNEVAERVYNTLAVDNAVVVRFRGRELNCAGALRISIGTEPENTEMLKKLGEVLAAARA